MQGRQRSRTRPDLCTQLPRCAPPPAPQPGTRTEGLRACTRTPGKAKRRPPCQRAGIGEGMGRPQYSPGALGAEPQKPQTLPPRCVMRCSGNRAPGTHGELGTTRGPCAGAGAGARAGAEFLRPGSLPRQLKRAGVAVTPALLPESHLESSLLA